MMAKRNHQTKAIGCPVCHKPAEQKLTQPSAWDGDRVVAESTEYLCRTATCTVLGFEVERMVSR